MRSIFLLFFLLSSSFLFSQKIYGVIKDENSQPLAYTSVVIKGTSKGVTANNKGAYSFLSSSGKYILVFQHIGYEALEKEIDLKEDAEFNITLKKQNLLLKELVIKSGSENPAYEIIRQAIKKRDLYNNEVNSFECDLYSKDLIKLRKLPNKIMGKKVPDDDRESMGLDSSGKGIIYLSEALSKVYKQKPDKFKMEVKSSRVSGSKAAGFTFPTFINLYSNNVSIFDGGGSSRGYVSPIADGAIRYYKFKMLGTYQESGKMVYSIKVTPRRNFEPLFSGIINITDEDYRIQSFDLTLTKNSQLDFLDTLKISQLHVPVGDGFWMVKDQLIFFNFKMLGIDAIGSFLTVFSNYETNKTFSKKFFDRTIIKYDSIANKKPINYWDTIRPVKLESEEVRDYKIKDSLLAVRSDSLSGYNNIDTLKKRQGKLKLHMVLYSNINRNHYSKKNPFEWGLESLVGNINYNSAEGIITKLGGYVEDDILHQKIKMLIQPNIRYGFSNGHLNSWVDLSFSQNKSVKQSKRRGGVLFLSGGKKVAQYNNENPVEPLFNSFSTLLNGLNIMKTYEKVYGGIAYRKRYESGFSFQIKTSYEKRLPIFNTSTYTFKKSDSLNLTENYPTDKVSINEIAEHEAMLTELQLSYRPGQRYIQFPDQKIPLRSKYPLFVFTYTKGIRNLLGSDVDFDKWNLDIKDNMNLKLAGEIKYKFSVGGFLNSNIVTIQDYKHFLGNPLKAALNNETSFQLMSSYANSNTEKYSVTTHFEHHLNGLISNKIPLINKLKWNLLYGTHLLYLSNNNHYEELYIGMENIFKLFRIDFVSAYQNGKFVKSGFAIGTGGTLGGSLKNRGNPKRSIGIEF
jgi:hypothetical protein